MRSPLLLFALYVCATSGLATAALAVTHHVPAEYTTIQAAMDASVAGDSVLVAPGTYTNCDGGPCTANVVMIKAGVALVAEGGPEVTTLRVDTGVGGLSVVRGVNILSGGGLLKGFTITGTAAAYRGALFMTCLGMVVEDCHFEYLEPGVQSGAGLKINRGGIVIRDCEFRGCGTTSPGGGAGCFCQDATTLIESCLFDACKEGGGAWIDDVTAATVAVRESAFLHNTGQASLVIVARGHAEIVASVFDGNVGLVNNVAALVVNNTMGTTDLRDNLFVANDGSIVGHVVSWNASGEIRGNTFWGNESKPGYATFLDGAPADLSTTMANNIFASNVGGHALHVYWLQPQASCNLFWANLGGDFGGEYVPSSTDLFVDPLLCGPAGGNFHLMTGSPCLPENSGACGLIGAFGEGCGATSVDEAARRSWGEIKSAYRAQRRAP